MSDPCQVCGGGTGLERYEHYTETLFICKDCGAADPASAFADHNYVSEATYNRSEEDKRAIASTKAAVGGRKRRGSGGIIVLSEQREGFVEKKPTHVRRDVTRWV